MPLYDFECDQCGHSDEVFQKHTDPNTSKCPKCGEVSYNKIFINAPYCSVKEVKTIGQLADRNSKINRSQLNEQKAMKEELKPKQEAPWYYDKEVPYSKINNMTKEQKKKYIMEGKT